MYDFLESANHRVELLGQGLDLIAAGGGDGVVAIPLGDALGPLGEVFDGLQDAADGDEDQRGMLAISTSGTD